MQKTITSLAALAIALIGASLALAQDQNMPPCSISPQVVQLVQNQLAVVVNLPGHNGGLFSPNQMWSAVVDRTGIFAPSSRPVMRGPEAATSRLPKRARRTTLATRSSRSRQPTCTRQIGRASCRERV